MTSLSAPRGLGPRVLRGTVTAALAVAALAVPALASAVPAVASAVPAVASAVPAVASAVPGVAGAVPAVASTVPAVSSTAATNGIDVSHWQGPIDWPTVRSASTSFVLIKASGGTSSDPYFASSWSGARASGLYRGAYHYALPSAVAGSAAAQARFFVATAGRAQGVGDLAPVLDIEATGGLPPTQLQAWVTSWLTTVKALTGRIPIVYTYPSFWRTAMADSTAFHAYPLWIANYGVSSPSVPGGWPTWTFWQRSNDGTVSGISGAVDLDSFHGSAAALAAVAHPATHPTSWISASSIYQGETTVFYSGHLTAATGPALAGAKVTLYRRSAGSSTWSPVGWTWTSQASGYYGFNLQPSATASYQARYAGGSTFTASSSYPRSVTVLPARAATHPTSGLTRSWVHPGGSLVVYGFLRTTAGTPLANQSVSLYQRNWGSAAWTWVGSVRTSSVAYYSMRVAPSRSVVYQLRYSGSSTYRPSSSYARWMTVR